jgi:hypothetical protein
LPELPDQLLNNALVLTNKFIFTTCDTRRWKKKKKNAEDDAAAKKAAKKAPKKKELDEDDINLITHIWF